MRRWKTHDVVDLFHSVRAGRIPCNSRQFTNHHLSDDPQIPIKKLDPNWPQHMDIDKPDTEPEYKIETGVPVPAIHRKEEYKWMPVLLALQPGQSFFIPLESDEESQKIIMRVRERIVRYRKSNGELFITRRIKASPENPQMGVRIWRVS